MKIDMKNWIASVIASPQRVAVPIMTHSGIELLGHTLRLQTVKYIIRRLKFYQRNTPQKHLPL